MLMVQTLYHHYGSALVSPETGYNDSSGSVNEVNVVVELGVQTDCMSVSHKVGHCLKV